MYSPNCLMENQYYRRDIALFIGDVPFMPPLTKSTTHLLIENYPQMHRLATIARYLHRKKPRVIMLHEHMARKAKCTEWVEFSCKLVHTTCSCFLCAAMGRTLRSCFLVLLFLSCRFELRSMCFAMSFQDRAKAQKPFIEASCFPPLRHMRQGQVAGKSRFFSSQQVQKLQSEVHDQLGAFPQFLGLQSDFASARHESQHRCVRHVGSRWRCGWA